MENVNYTANMERLVADLRLLGTHDKTAMRNDDNFRPMSHWAVIQTAENNPDRMN